MYHSSRKPAEPQHAFVSKIVKRSSRKDASKNCQNKIILRLESVLILLALQHPYNLTIMPPPSNASLKHCPDSGRKTVEPDEPCSVGLVVDRSVLKRGDVLSV